MFAFCYPKEPNDVDILDSDILVIEFFFSDEVIVGDVGGHYLLQMLLQHH